MRIAVIILLWAAASNAAETIDIPKDTPMQDVLIQVGKQSGKIVLFDPNDQRVRNQKIGAPIKLEVEKERLFDTYRAILTFYELTLIPVGSTASGIHLAVNSRSTNNFIKNKAKFVAPEDVEDYAEKDGQFIATFFPIQHVENMTLLRTALSTMVSPAGIGRVMEIPGAGIIVMDFAPTVAGIGRILRKADMPTGQSVSMRSFELKNASAQDVAMAIRALYPAQAASTRARGFVMREFQPKATVRGRVPLGTELSRNS